MSADQVYERTENGATTHVSRREGLNEINHAMTGGKRDVRTMSSITRTDFVIEYKDGRNVRLVLVDAPDEPREWHGTHSSFNHLHRFTDDNRARCNRSIRANVTPPNGGKGPWGVFKRTRSEVEADDHADLYTFCPRCEEK